MVRRKKGSSIIEVVFATTLISMGVIAALSLTNQSQKSATNSRLLEAATSYNNQLADFLRNQKTSLGYATLAEKLNADATLNSVTYCINTIPADSATFLALAPGNCAASDVISGTIYSRRVIIDTSATATGTIKAKVETTWYDKQTRTNSLDMEITKWN